MDEEFKVMLDDLLRMRRRLEEELVVARAASNEELAAGLEHGIVQCDGLIAFIRDGARPLQ
jgi:hypothetical protein